MEENDKKSLVWIGRREKGRKVFEKIWKQWRTREKTLFKTLNFQILISRIWASIDQKLDSIDQVLIEHQSSQAYSNQSFNRNFDWLSNSFDWLKIWKSDSFEKHIIFYA